MQQYLPFTVLKLMLEPIAQPTKNVATVLTVYGIETPIWGFIFIIKPELQQYLPFTVLKLDTVFRHATVKFDHVLQQYLPFTVLKLK